MSIKIFKFVNKPKPTNPFPHETLNERLVKDKVIDMRDNYRIIEHNDGYISVVPIDKTKLWKPDESATK